LVGGRPETTVIDSIEIVEPALETLQRLNGYRPYSGLVANPERSKLFDYP
jgi:hypothetical protein